MITIDFSSRGNAGLCDFLIEQIKLQIKSGHLKPDEKLPSKRSLSEHLGVSVITVQNAYAQLISEGYIYSIEKKGFFVTELKFFGMKDHQKIQPEKKGNSDSRENYAVDFKNNSTAAEKFPFNLWSRTMRQVLNTRDEKLLERSSVKGVYELRKAIAGHLNDFRNMQVSPRQIVIGAGTESLYSMLVQFFGTEKKIAVENPGYHKVREVFLLSGSECVPVATDSMGIDVQELNASGADCVHVSPSHHFPTGIIMPVKRREELLLWANESEGRYIIEDDYDSEFRFTGKLLPTLQSSDSQSKVIYVNTFSKTLSPSFRICYMVLPEKLVEAFENKMRLYSCQVSAFEQFTLARFISEGHYEKHINRMKNYYRSLRDSFITAIKNSRLSEIASIREEDSGLHFLLSIESPFSDYELEKRMRDQKINIALLSDYYYKADAEGGRFGLERDSGAGGGRRSQECNPEAGSGHRSQECNLSSGGNRRSNVFVVNYSALERESVTDSVRRLCAACGIR